MPTDFTQLADELAGLLTTDLQPTPEVLQQIQRATDLLDVGIEEALKAQRITSGEAAQFHLIILKNRKFLAQYGES